MGQAGVIQDGLTSRQMHVQGHLKTIKLGGGVAGGALYLTLHSHHQNDSIYTFRLAVVCEPFNISLTVGGGVHHPQLLKRKERQ